MKYLSNFILMNIPDQAMARAALLLILLVAPAAAFLPDLLAKLVLFIKLLNKVINVRSQFILENANTDFTIPNSAF